VEEAGALGKYSFAVTRFTWRPWLGLATQRGKAVTEIRRSGFLLGHYTSMRSSMRREHTDLMSVPDRLWTFSKLVGGNVKYVPLLMLLLIAAAAEFDTCDAFKVDPYQSGPLVPRMHVLASASSMLPERIPPLYVSPALPGEGIWHWKDMPTGESGRPIIFKTTYRPSVHYPNAIVHMFLFNMKHVSMRLCIGSAEEGGSAASARIERQDRPSLLAVTNGLWKLKHSGGGGIIFRGKVMKKPAPGLATLVVYKDQSIDIVEWNERIPISEISDARQLKHLIVSDGKVVESIRKGTQTADAEIGLGALLDESRPLQIAPVDNPSGGKVMNFTSGPNWFIATRSAFGIRGDGNLVFAIGHHISTKDLAKALALAGCVRGIHADANPGNCIGTIYRMDEEGNVLSLAKLSPQQDDFTSKRYVMGPVQSDFYAFFKRLAETSAQ
jgi:hypothetical protein